MKWLRGLARSLIGTLALTLIVGCGDDDDGPTALDPDQFELTIISGGGASGIVGTVVSEALTVSVNDRNTGAPETGVLVAWSVVAGNGRPTRATSATGLDGHASTLVELGTVAGDVQLSAEVAGLPSVAFTAIDALPAPSIQSLSASSADPGDMVDVRVNDLPTGMTAEVLFDGVAGEIVTVTSGSPSVIETVVPAPVGVCSATSDPVDVRVRVGGFTTDSETLTVSVPADPFQVGQVLVIEADSGQSVSDVQCALLPADGGTAKYLLVTLSAAFEKAGQFQVTLGAENVAVARAQAGVDESAARAFHGGLRAFERQLLERGLPRARSRVGDGRLFGGPPILGSQRQFWVINDSDAPDDGIVEEGDFDRVNATLRFAGVHTLLYVDNAAPSGGLTEQDIQRLGVVYDQLLYEANLDFFGDASDVNGDGQVTILLSPTVNGLTPRGSEGFVVGFFFGLDIFGPSTPNCDECEFSNGMELLYGIVPDPDGQFSDPRSTERVVELLPGVTTHETQHLINFNWKVLENDLAFLETLWLSEAEAHMAEEFSGDLVDAGGDMSLADQLYESNFGRAARYLEAPQDFSLTAVDGGGDLGERGAGWLFMRWIADQYGDFILRDLTQAAPFGVENVEAQTGESFFRLFADWSVAVWADDQDIPNLSRRYTFPKWALRSIIRIEPTGGGDPVYALQPLQQTFSQFKNSSISEFMAASSAFYVELDAGGDMTDLQLTLSALDDAGIAILRFE